MIGAMADLATRINAFRQLSSQQWAEAGLRAAPALVAGVLVIALAWQLVQLTWVFLGAGSATPATSPAVAAASPAPVVDLRRIVDAHLFGIASSEPNPADLNTAPQTQMNLVLTGTMAGSDPQQGFAIIGESSATAKTFPTGQNVRPGTKLHSVYTDRVILDNSGRLETLVLPRQSTGGAVMARPLPPPAAQGGGIGEDLRRIAETNPGAFSAVVRPQPVFANGVQRGYRVYPARNRRGFSRLGLQPGDLITSINGTPLDDPSRGMEIFNSLNSASQVNLTIERNGQTQQLSLDTTVLASLDSEQPEPPPAEAPTGPPPTFESAPAAQ